MPIVFRIFDWVANSRIAQGVLALLAILFALKWRDNSLETKHRREERKRVVEQIEEQTNERIEKARTASDDLNARSLEQLRQQRARDPNNRSGV